MRSKRKVWRPTKLINESIHIKISKTTVIDGCSDREDLSKPSVSNRKLRKREVKKNTQVKSVEKKKILSLNKRESKAAIKIAVEDDIIDFNDSEDSEYEGSEEK